MARNTEWRTIGMTVAELGWRVLFHNAENPTKPLEVRVVGWLLQEELDIGNSFTFLEEQDPFREHRVVAGVLDGESGEVVPETSGMTQNYWYLAEPGDKPGETECLEAYHGYEERKKRDEARRMAKLEKKG